LPGGDDFVSGNKNVENEINVFKSKINIYLVHVRIHVLQLFDGGVGGAVPLLYVLFEIVLPARLESADRTRVRGRLHKTTSINLAKPDWTRAGRNK
jgi:hypothetical protein